MARYVFAPPSRYPSSSSNRGMSIPREPVFARVRAHIFQISITGDCLSTPGSIGVPGPNPAPLPSSSTHPYHHTETRVHHVHHRTSFPDRPRRIVIRSPIPESVAPAEFPEKTDVASPESTFGTRSSNIGCQRSFTLPPEEPLHPPRCMGLPPMHCVVERPGSGVWRD